MPSDSPEPVPRIAFISGRLNLGGTTTFLCNLGGELVRRSIPVQVLSFERQNPLAQEFERQNIPVYCLDQRKMIFEDRLEKILNRLKEFRPTAVLATLSGTSFEPLRYLPAGILRVGVGQSDDPEVYGMMRRYASFLDRVAVVSQEMKRKVSTMPEFSNIPIVYLPYGVPMPSEIPSRNFGRPLRILYLGRLDREQKRVQLFPAIFNQLQAKGIPFHWTVAGDGPEKAALESAMKSCRADQTVSFPGQIAYQHVTKILLEHDVFLLASDYEGLPLSLLEAMGCGVVPVVSALPSGIPEVVDETTGKLVSPDNTAGYAEAIISLHENRNSLAKFSAVAREKVWREFSISAMTNRWLREIALFNTVGSGWVENYRIRAPLGMRNPIYFSPAVRILRRIILRLHGRN